MRSCYPLAQLSAASNPLSKIAAFQRKLCKLTDEKSALLLSKDHLRIFLGSSLGVVPTSSGNGLLPYWNHHCDSGGPYPRHRLCVPSPSVNARRTFLIGKPGKPKHGTDIIPGQAYLFHR